MWSMGPLTVYKFSVLNRQLTVQNWQIISWVLSGPDHSGLSGLKLASPGHPGRQWTQVVDERVVSGGQQAARSGGDDELHDAVPRQRRVPDQHARHQLPPPARPSADPDGGHGGERQPLGSGERRRDGATARSPRVALGSDLCVGYRRVTITLFWKMMLFWRWFNYCFNRMF